MLPNSALASTLALIGATPLSFPPAGCQHLTESKALAMELRCFLVTTAVPNKQPSLKLTFGPGKRMVGIGSFPVGMAYFEGQAVSFREVYLES